MASVKKVKRGSQPLAGITVLENSGSMQLNDTVGFFGRLRCYSVGKNTLQVVFC